MEKSKVYFTKEITEESLIKIYNATGKKLEGKVAVKISTGEPGGHNFLQPSLIKGLVQKLGGTIVECCTAYDGKRMDPKLHRQVFVDHGFDKIAPWDLMDEDDEIHLPVNKGFHLKTNIVGKNLTNYDSMLILSHFKGHMMAGFGGALKNMSIGIASSSGKANIHTAGATEDPKELFNKLPKQDYFLESMADACKAVEEFMKKEYLLYINVANRLSVDCDCDSNPAEPEMADIGIFASEDPVAIDQACYDAVKNSSDEGKKALIERMDSRHGIHVVEAACELGLGTREYEIICID